MRNNKVCPSCGYDHRENPINAPTGIVNKQSHKVATKPQKSQKPLRTGTYSVCTSCGYQLKNSMMCPSCGQDNRNSKAGLSIDTSERIGYSTEDDLLLRRWLGILFWLIIPSVIGSIMSNMASLVFEGNVIKVLTSLAYGLILLRLSRVEDNYQKAGTLWLVSMGMALLPMVGINLGPILSISALVISLVALFYEYNGHSSVLDSVDEYLSDAWEQLWKWTLYVYVGLIGGLLLLFVSLTLGYIVVIFALIGLIIVSIVKIVFLYKTARSF
jgi:hypothetical protein